MDSGIEEHGDYAAMIDSHNGMIICRKLVFTMKRKREKPSQIVKTQRYFRKCWISPLVNKSPLK